VEFLGLSWSSPMISFSTSNLIMGHSSLMFYLEQPVQTTVLSRVAAKAGGCKLVSK